jgi:hypothetical protein
VVEVVDRAEVTKERIMRAAAGTSPDAAPMPRNGAA